jgi:5-methylcytosine-specific restriction endonuclease McrA
MTAILPARVPSSAAPVARVLVLNATYEALSVVSGRRAVWLVLDDKADVIHEGDRLVRSERLALPVPSVVRLRSYIKVPFQRRATLNRRAVFARDAHRCQYCGAPAESIDHVLPRSRGGPHAWENVVAACRPCNVKKRDRLPEESGMRLRRSPCAPRGAAWVAAAVGRVPEHWTPYLGGWGAELAS